MKPPPLLKEERLSLVHHKERTSQILRVHTKVFANPRPHDLAAETNNRFFAGFNNVHVRRRMIIGVDAEVKPGFSKNRRDRPSIITESITFLRDLVVNV
jgi:hypothetical protein